MVNLLFIGPQGSGKGTQAQIISRELEIPHISTGELFRNLEGELKSEIDSYINKGDLVPDKLTIKILKQRIQEYDCKNGFILDGFPRNLSQVKLLKKITNIDKVIEITLNDKDAINRISGRVSCSNCGAGFNELTEPKPITFGICDKCRGKLLRRKDDNPEAVKKRLQIYHSETEPILKEYKDKLIKINGNRPIEEITVEIIENLEK